MKSRRTLLGSAALVLFVAACNYTVGECYPRGEADGSAEVGVGAGVGPSGAGGYGDMPPGGGWHRRQLLQRRAGQPLGRRRIDARAAQRRHGARHVCPMPGPGLDHLRIDVPRYRGPVLGARSEPAESGVWCRQAQAVPAERSGQHVYVLLQQWDELHATQRVWGVDPLVVHLHGREGMRVAVIAPHPESSYPVEPEERGHEHEG